MTIRPSNDSSPPDSRPPIPPGLDARLARARAILLAGRQPPAPLLAAIPAYCETFHHNARLAEARATWPTAQGVESVYLCGSCAGGPVAEGLSILRGRARPGFRLEPWEPGIPPEPRPPSQHPLWR